MSKRDLEDGYLNIHQDLVDRARNRDEDATSALYKLYSKAMFNSCIRITNNRDDAEDVLQEAFVSAFTNLHSYRAESTFGSWLKRIVVNKAINHVNKRRINIVDSEPEKLEVFEEDYIDTEDKEFKVEQIKKAMEQLPDGYRMVFSLYLFEGYDHQEIGEILNISTSTSKSQYNRAKKKLRELLEK